MFGGDKTGISQLFVKHCEQTDHHPTMQQHLEKVEAIEVLDCTSILLFQPIHLCAWLSSILSVLFNKSSSCVDQQVISFCVIQ